MIRVALADDHPIIREGLERWMHTVDDVTIVGVASDYASLHEILEGANPDVVVVDYSMPGLTGATSIGQIVERGHAVVVFSLLEREEVLRSLVEVGIAGFVSKSQPVSELLEVVRAVAGGERVLPSFEDAEPRPHELLSERERGILDRVLLGQTPKEIAFDLEVSTSSVYTYVERIRKKLGVESTQGLIQYAHRVGLVDGGAHRGS